MTIVLENAQEPADPVDAAVAALVEAAGSSALEYTLPVLEFMLEAAAIGEASDEDLKRKAEHRASLHFMVKPEFNDRHAERAEKIASDREAAGRDGRPARALAAAHRDEAAWKRDMADRHPKTEYGHITGRAAAEEVTARLRSKGHDFEMPAAYRD